MSDYQATLWIGWGKKKAKQWYKPRNLTLLTSDPFWSQWSWDLCLETDYRFYSWNSFIQSPRILFRFFLLTRVLSIRPSGIQGLARFDLSCNSADLCGSVRVYGEGMCMYKLFWFGSAWCGWWWRGSTQTKTFILPFQSFLVYQKRIFFSHVVFSEKVLFCNVSFQLWKTVRNDCRSSIYDISLLGTAISLLTFLSIT